MKHTAQLETDYLVVGAGLAGIAFADALVGTDATITLVDRLHAPGGHWLNAYPFVRLHQPSRLYGVPSVPLGQDRIMTHGIDEGFYERASGPEIVGYFDRVMRDRLLASGQVRFLHRTEYLGGGRLRSIGTGSVTEITVRRRVVDARYLEGSIPATSPPPFEVADGARCVAPGDLVRMDAPEEGFVVIGAGKTSMDTVLYLLEQGVDADRIRWVRPHDLWLLNRFHFQGGRGVLHAKEGTAIQLEAAADATDVEDYYRRCADAGLFLALDADTTPRAIHGATSHAREIDALRQVGHVIRLGYVERLERDRIVTTEGNLPTSAGWVHVNCATSGIPHARRATPIFQRDRITMQYVRLASPSFSYGIIGFLEASGRSDEEKNALLHPNPLVGTPLGWIQGTVQSFGQGALWRNEPDLAAWLDNRLNLMQGISAVRKTREGQAVDARFRAAMGPGASGLRRLAEAPDPAGTAAATAA